MCDNWHVQHEEARRRGHDLAALRLHWYEAYGITWDTDPAEFVAQRRDNGGTLRAKTATELRIMIGDDHAEKPVPREYRLDQSEYS